VRKEAGGGRRGEDGGEEEEGETLGFPTKAPDASKAMAERGCAWARKCATSVSVGMSSTATCARARRGGGEEGGGEEGEESRRLHRHHALLCCIPAHRGSASTGRVGTCTINRGAEACTEKLAVRDKATWREDVEKRVSHVPRTTPSCAPAPGTAWLLGTEGSEPIVQ